MAELTASSSRTSKGKSVRGTSNKRATRVDLTPMVDLGFLLITFFIFTTTMASKKSMDLNMPDDKTTHVTGTRESGTITLLLDEQAVYYFEGFLDARGSNLKKISYKQVRDVLIAKKRSTPEKYLFVVIKATGNSVFKNTIDVLDEMMITDIHRYAVADIEPTEEQLVANNDPKH